MQDEKRQLEAIAIVNQILALIDDEDEQEDEWYANYSSDCQDYEWMQRN